MSCGLVQTRPRPAGDALWNYYPREYSEPLGPPGTPSIGLRGLAREACDALLNLRARRVTPVPFAHTGDAHLEIGCADGQVFGQLEARGWEVWGIEPSPKTAPIAQEKLTRGGRVIMSDAEHADLPRASFRRIALTHVIEHLREPVLVLRRTREWIAPNGTLLINCPNYASWERRLFGRFWFALEVPRHLYHFTPATLRRLLELTGWRARSIRAQPISMTLGGTIAILLDLARGGNHEFRDADRLRRPVELVDHVAHLLGAAPCIEVVAEPA